MYILTLCSIFGLGLAQQSSKWVKKVEFGYIWVMWGSYDVVNMHCILYRCSRLNESETKDTKQKVLKVSNWNRTDLVEKIMFKDQTIEIWAYSKSKESRRIVLAPVISLRNLRESDSIAISNVTNVYSS